MQGEIACTTEGDTSAAGSKEAPSYVICNGKERVPDVIIPEGEGPITNVAKTACWGPTLNAAQNAACQGLQSRVDATGVFDHATI